MTTFGMEFEVEGISPRRASEYLNAGGVACDYVDSDIHETHDSWKSVHDGSLNNGAEVVSPILRPSRLNEAHKVAKILKDAGARTSTTAGFHIHLGARAFDNARESLPLFVLNYYAVHHAFAPLVAPSRTNGNRYCRVLSRDEAEKQAQYLRDGNMGAYNGDRYCSLNLDALERHSTIEVRLHQSTLNGVKAIAWAKLMDALLKTANAGIDLGAIEALGAWKPIEFRRASRSLEHCPILLDTLVANGSLESSIGDWLKVRARVLNK